MKRRISLKYKVLLAFVMTLIVPLGSTFWSARQSSFLKGQAEELSTKLFPILEATNAIAIQLNDIKEAYQSACMEADEDALQKADQMSEELARDFETISTANSEDHVLAELSKKSSSYCGKASEIARSIIGGSEISDLIEDISSIAVIAASLYDDIKEYREEKSVVFAENASNMAEQCRVMKLFSFGSVFASVLVSLVLAFFVVAGVGSLTKGLKSTIRDLTEGSQQVSSASRQIHSAAQSLAESTTMQAAELEETSSSLEQVSSMTRQNADNAQQANTLVSEVRNAANTGAESMARMNEAIEVIQKSSNETAKIVRVIDEIAFQTNLLALNAAVEAARVGEAGKGFAVVAEEVHNLAMRSAEAAKNTSELIEESVKNSKNGVDIAGEVGKVLEEVVGSIGKMSDLVGEITVASAEQSQGIDLVNTAVNQMDKVTQENAANAEESASASEELSAQAEQMNQIVEELSALVGGSSGNVKTRTTTTTTATRTQLRTCRATLSIR